jgi:hypothetical protein
MGLMSAYLITTKNAKAFFNALQTARAPERFSTKFMKDLDFTSSNDRLYLGVLKGLGFIDEGGTPTKIYFDFLDHSQSGRVLAGAIQVAYEDLFALNRSAQDLGLEEVRGKFRSLTQGQKSENVINLMANTFTALCELADWSSPPAAQVGSRTEVAEHLPAETPTGALPDMPRDGSPVRLGLHYNIQLILPESRDQAVYDALFSSLRRHLL